MTTRVTIRQAEGALRAYCTTIRAPYGQYVTLHDPTAPLTIDQDGRTFPVRVLSTHDDGRRFCTIPGGYALDGAYSGYSITRISDELHRDGRPVTGISHPLGDGYWTPRELVDQLRAARFAVIDERARHEVTS